MIPAGLKPRVYDDKIVDWERDLYPTASIVMENSKKTVSAPSWSRWERKPYPHWITATAALTAADVDWTTAGDFSADHLTRITRYDAWQVVRTREVVLMNGTAAAPAGTVVRGVGSVPAQALIVGDKLVKVQTAFPEGSTAPTAHFVLEDEITFRAAEHYLSTEATSHVLATKFEIEGNKRKAGIELARVEFTSIMKRSFFSAAQAQQQTATAQQQTVKGMMEHCQTWSYNFNGILTRPDFGGFVADGPGRYIRGDIGIAMSSLGLGIVDNWLTDIAQAQQDKDINTLGFNVDNLKLVAGRRAKLFYESWLDEDPTTQGWFFVFPLNKVQGSKHVTVSGPEWDGRVQLFEDIKKEDGYLGKKDAWYHFYGWEHGPEIGYGFGYGVEG
jgi:hypothetical protein